MRNCRGYLTAGDLLGCSWRRLLAGAAMCLLVMAIGRSPISGNILKLAVQVLSGTVFYAAALYLMNDAMLKEMLALAVSAAKKVCRLLIGKKN